MTTHNDHQPAPRLVVCHVCAALQEAADGERCVRCGAVIGGEE